MTKMLTKERKTLYCIIAEEFQDIDHTPIAGPLCFDYKISVSC
jgi:hypothetical protein